MTFSTVTPSRDHHIARSRAFKQDRRLVQLFAEIACDWTMLEDGDPPTLIGLGMLLPWVGDQ